VGGRAAATAWPCDLNSSLKMNWPLRRTRLSSLSLGQGTELLLVCEEMKQQCDTPAPVETNNPGCSPGEGGQQYTGGG